MRKAICNTFTILVSSSGKIIPNDSVQLPPRRSVTQGGCCKTTSHVTGDPLQVGFQEHLMKKSIEIVRLLGGRFLALSRMLPIE